MLYPTLCMTTEEHTKHEITSLTSTLTNVTYYFFGGAQV